LAERFEKARCLFSGESNYAHFCDHDRPAKDRTNRESQENDLSRDGGMFKSEKEPTAREEFREQNRRQVELISNAFSEKQGPRIGNVGRILINTGLQAGDSPLQMDASLFNGLLCCP